MAYYSVHAGHGKQDSKSCGASTNLLKESVANREVKDEVIKLLKTKGHTVYDDTVDYPASASDCVNKQVKNVNSHSKIDLAIGIHFNSGRNDIGGDGSIGGYETIVCNNTGSKQEVAKRIGDKVATRGLRNRGVKVNTKLGFLNNTNCQAIIVECCFVDDKDDVKLYNALGAKEIAKAIVEGILNTTIESSGATEKPSTSEGDEIYYRVITSSHKSKELAQKALAEAKAKGFNDAFLTTFKK